MNYKKYKSARVAAAHALPLAMEWTLYYGEPCDGDELMKFAACLDSENPLTEEECYYVTDESGSLGITINDGHYVSWLATATVPVPAEEKMEIAETPEIVIKEEIHDKVAGLRKLLTLKGLLAKVLITGGIMLLVWLVTMIWQRYCATHGKGTPFIASIFAYLTFGNGGVSSNPFYMLGGFVGKSFVMTTVIAIVAGGFKKVGSGVGVMVNSIKGLTTLKRFGLFISGMGGACIVYNFFVGSARFSMTMAGIAGVLSMLWAMGGGVHFLRRMTVALTAYVNKRSRIHYVDMPNANSVLSGMAIGFVISIVLSILPFWGFAPYLFGIYWMAISGLLFLIGRSQNVQ